MTKWKLLHISSVSKMNIHKDNFNEQKFCVIIRVPTSAAWEDLIKGCGATRALKERVKTLLL